MTDQELRELVRESIAKQLGGDGWRSPSGLASPRAARTPAQSVHIHASHGVYTLARENDDGPCIIEPSVPCTHCNFCKSHGH